MNTVASHKSSSRSLYETNQYGSLHPKENSEMGSSNGLSEKLSKTSLFSKNYMATPGGKNSSKIVITPPKLSFAPLRNANYLPKTQRFNRKIGSRISSHKSALPPFHSLTKQAIESPTQWRNKSSTTQQSFRFSSTHSSQENFSFDEFQRTSSCRLKFGRKDEALYELRDILNPSLVVDAICSLDSDRIRPLFGDVLQRLKHLAKLAVCKHSSEASIKNKFQDSITELDVCCLYRYVESNCKDEMIIEHPATRPPSSTANSLKALIDRNTNIPINPALSAYLNQVALKLRRPKGKANIINYFVSAVVLPWVDPHDKSNPYPLIVWRSLAAFLNSRLTSSQQLNSDNLLPYQFKGGRYGLAIILRNSGFPHLERLLLGELCHLVQLAISNHLLAYENSVLQPVAACQEISSVLLRIGSTEPGLSALEWPVVGDDSIPNEKRNDKRSYNTLEELATDLKIILQERSEGFVIAQLKKALYSRFGKDVLPRRFGYKKLTECLITSPIISNFCQIININSTNDCLMVTYKPYLKEVTPAQSPVAKLNLGSPGSQSTAATIDTSSPCLTPELQKGYPTSHVFQDDLFSPASNSLSITYCAWANLKQLGMSAILPGTNLKIKESQIQKKEFDFADNEIAELMRTISNFQIGKKYDHSYTQKTDGMQSTMSAYWDCFTPLEANF